MRHLPRRSGGLNPSETLDKIHAPDDAGAHREALVRIMRRIPDAWGRWISCSKGWYPLHVELDSNLAAIDATYVVHQVTEKLGRLRFYYFTEVEGARERMKQLVDEA